MTINRLDTLNKLKDYVNLEGNPQYVLFWDGIYSQWHPSPFTVGGIEYLTAEHWMMARKAETFNDQESLREVLGTHSPAVAKSVGRKIKNYDDSLWAKVKFEHVVIGNVHKFNQNPRLFEQMKNDAGKVLVEASPYDKQWGIGLGEDDPRALDVYTWQGLNLLGFACMVARDKLGVR